MTPLAAFDLHLHTCWSYDATAAPEAYFRRAQETGVRCIAITEHHVLDSLPEVLAIAEDYPDVRMIPAAELSVTASLGTFDLMCYGFPVPVPAELQPVLDRYHEWQRAYGAAICRGVQALGHDFSDEQRLELLQTYRPPKAIEVQGNTHVKNAVLRQYFVDRGFIASAEDYAPLLDRARQEVPFPPYPTVADVVPAIKQFGVLVAIAHPRGYFNGNDAARMDAIRDECQLDGIECAHPSVPAEYTPIYREYCVHHGMFSVGGSDCHANEHLESFFARHPGAEDWLDEFLDAVGGVSPLAP